MTFFATEGLHNGEYITHELDPVFCRKRAQVLGENLISGTLLMPNADSIYIPLALDGDGNLPTEVVILFRHVNAVESTKAVVHYQFVKVREDSLTYPDDLTPEQQQALLSLLQEQNIIVEVSA